MGVSHLGRGRLYLEVGWVGQQVLGKLHGETGGLTAVAVRVQGLSTGKQYLESTGAAHRLKP